MNKTDLIELIAEHAETSKAAATRTLEAILSGMTETLKSGEDVTITGFGTFKKRHRAARTGRNPQTNEPMEIKASNSVGFKAGKALKDALN